MKSTTKIIITLVIVLYGSAWYNIYQTTKLYEIVHTEPIQTDSRQVINEIPYDFCGLNNTLCLAKEVVAKVTGYNTVPEQTDATPCWAGGYYICGRNDVVACPRWIEKETWVSIDGKFYECVDRLALKYDMRFDISCDKDMECPYEVSGIKTVKIYR